MNAIESLMAEMQKKDTLVCVGLDPDPKKYPENVPANWGSGEGYALNFLQAVIDITVPFACAFKAQKAFFDCYNGGHDLLKKTIGYVHSHYPATPIFLDCKIGDTENTMDAYMANIFDNLEADGVVLNPYMGDEVMTAMAQYHDKAGIVLVKTSNPGAAIVQDYQGLWKHILDLVVDRWNTADNLIPVITSTAEIDLAYVRTRVPDEMPILFAGYGAQGGNLTGVQRLLNSKGIGVFVNSSRGILYPYESSEVNWRQSIRSAVVSMADEINDQRR